MGRQAEVAASYEQRKTETAMTGGYFTSKSHSPGIQLIRTGERLLSFSFPYAGSTN
jgi:hypothetical protein